MRHVGWVLVAACGGAIAGPGPNDGGGGDASPVSDAGTGTVTCPTSPPPSGGACNGNGLLCEYGTSPIPSCNDQFACENGSWLEQAGMTCPSPSLCPATFDGPWTMNCSPDQLACVYPQGMCFCSHGSMAFMDQWFCSSATTQCPSPRPDLGAPCSTPGQDCNYGACFGGVELLCSGGVWTHGHSVTCPQ